MGKPPGDSPEDPGERTFEEVPFVFGKTGLATPAVVRRAVADSVAPTTLIAAVHPRVLGAVKLKPPESPPALAPALEYTGSADPEGIRLLESGDIEGFNALREKYPDWIPDLRRINFSGKNLAGIDLHDAILERANCSGANFTAADLSGARLEEVNMTGANLSSANLTEAHCKGVIFRETDFLGAKLAEAICSFAVFIGAKNLTVNQLCKCLLNNATCDSDLVDKAIDFQKATVRRLRQQ